MLPRLYAQHQPTLSSILILHNPEYLYHFLNGCYLISKDTDATADADEPSSLEESHLSLFRLSRQALAPSSHYLHNIFRFSLSWDSWHGHQPNLTSSASPLTDGPALVLSMKPTYAKKAHAALHQFLDNRQVRLCFHEIPRQETTLSWVCGMSGKPVGYVCSVHFA